MQYIPFDGKVRIIFVFQAASFWITWESLYQRCVEDERFDVKLLWIDDRKKGDWAQMKSAKSFLERSGIAYEMFNHDTVIKFRPHYMVYQTPFEKGHRRIQYWTARYRRLGVRIVYLPYGIEIANTEEAVSKHFGLPVVLNAFRIYVLSDAILEEYKTHCINAEAVRAIGLPRFDSLRDANRFSLSDALQSRINGRKIILWKAHFPKVLKEGDIHVLYTPYLKEYLNFVRYIQQHKELFFIFMPHPKFADAHVSPELLRLAEQLLAQLDTLENVYIDWADDYRYSLLNADGIIVDRSTVMVEAGVTGKPVLYMSNANYDEPMTPPIRALLDSYTCGTRTKDMEDFAEKIRMGQDETRKERMAAVQRIVPGLDGKRGWAVMEDLWESVHQNEDTGMAEVSVEDAKIILFGTGDISRYCYEYMDGWPSGQVIAYADNDFKKQGMLKNNIEIVIPADIPAMEFDYVVIASEMDVNPIYRQLTVTLGVPKEKVLTYDQYIVMCRFAKDYMPGLVQ